jgi:hypothetical protein
VNEFDWVLYMAGIVVGVFLFRLVAALVGGGGRS